MTETAFRELIAPYGERIVIDIGTGDGLFVYHSALTDPATFFIGVDPNVKALQHISQKITRKSSRGGIPNALFVRSTAQDLPQELAGIAHKIHVNFPWGSLLGVMLGSAPGLRQLRTVCHPKGTLLSVISLDFQKDKSEMERLGLQIGSLEFLPSLLTDVYSSAGWQLRAEFGSTLPAVRTTWAHKLKQNPERLYIKINAWPIAE